MAPQNPLSLDNPVMRDLVFYSTIVLLKMMAMSLVTTLARLSKGVFSNQEDVGITTGGKIQFNNESVERTRRNHLNDLENIPAFVLIGLLYVLTNPAPSTALWVFRIFAGSRIMHTLAYQLPLPQPSRAISFLVGFGATAFMAIKCFLMCL